MKSAAANNVKDVGLQSINISKCKRACANCIWYRQYYLKNAGNIAMFLPSDTGQCLQNGRNRSALSRPCNKFITQL